MAQKMTEERYAEIELLQRYRRDRRMLLEYLCEASSLKKVVMPLGAVTLADVDLDNVSVNYVLEACKSRGTLDLAEAIKQHFKELSLAPSFGTGDSEIFLLATNPKHSGGPPARPAPEKPGPSYAHLGAGASRSVPGTPSRSSSIKASPGRPLTPTESYEDGVEEFEDLDDEPVAKKQFADTKELVLTLPAFETGLTDDDIRETAYEVLLTAVGDTGALQPPPKIVEEKKKKTLLRRSSKSRSKTATAEPAQAHGLSGLLEIIRGQMEIGDIADRRTKDALLRAAANRQGRRINTLLVPLELLSAVPQSEFANKRDYIRWEKRQLNILIEGLVNQPAVKMSPSNEQLGIKLRQIVARVEEAQMLPAPAGPTQHIEALRDLRAVATALAERSNRGESSDEVIHWADGYPLSVRLYEALLFNIFDMFDPSQLIDEIDEVLELLQSTWRILGVTRAVHDVCLAWVLFKQFVVTGNSDLLSTAASHLKKMVSDGGQSAQERAYMQLMQTVSGEGGKSYSYVQSALDPIKQWADRRLNDYQREFPNGASGVMESLLSVAMVSGRLLADETDTPQGSFLSASRSSAAGERAAMVKQAEAYVRSSLKAAYLRAVREVEGQATDGQPTLAGLARLVREIAKEEASNYSPVLIRWNVNAKVVAAATLHELYRADLKPFLDGVTQLSDEVTAVLPVAEALEAFLMDMTAGADQTDEGAAILETLKPFGVNDMSATLIGRWINHQLGGLSHMVDRSVATEQWESLSQTQRYGPSVVEVFRIIEETLDQFYAMKLPMRSSLLRGLTVGFDTALQQYISKLLAQIGDRDDLIPPAPALTRFKKDVVAKVAEKESLGSGVKKRDPRLPDEAREAEIATLTVTTLSVRLNTLHFILSQLEGLENSIRQRWSMKNPLDPLSRSSSRRGSASEDPRRSPRPRSLSTGSNLEDLHGEFFAGTKKAATGAIEKLADFLGTKVVFWDLRARFIDSLYRTNASDCRMEKMVVELDAVLSELCEVIAEPLRDRAVLSLLQASLEGLQRVLLDGGPTRAFTAADGELLEEDLTILKDFFIAEGDGLPRTVVENSAAKTAQILHLFELPTDQLVENFQVASREMAGSNGAAQSGTSRSATDADTLLRVICHRADRDASKFLKKSYKLPKTESR